MFNKLGEGGSAKLRHGPVEEKASARDIAAENVVSGSSNGGSDPEETGDTSLEGRAFRKVIKKEQDEIATEEDGSTYYVTESADLVESMGTSGLCLLDMKQMNELTGLPLLATLPLLAIQGFMLQASILYFMSRHVHKRIGTGDLSDMPQSIVIAAIYVHIIHCVQSAPLSLAILKHLPDLHTKSELCVVYPLFILDAVIVPTSVLIVGSFYLCTSETISDVILNSCAVAFISNIDNWILGLNRHLEMLADIHVNEEVHIPVNVKNIARMTWMLCIFPVVPLLMAFGLHYIGINIWHLDENPVRE